MPRSHLCWGYRRPEEFAVRARAYLAEGLAAGERVLYVAPGDTGALIGRLRAVEAFGEGMRRGAVQVASVDSTYPRGSVVDPVAQVRAYATATEEALAAGFTGLRVAADATTLVRTPAQLDAFARYEHLVDHYMAAHPMSAMCAYDLGELGDEALAQLACMHPSSSADATPFHLHGHTRDNSSAALDGELDGDTRELWSGALERAEPRAVDGAVTIDATGLEFIDHRSLLVVADYADRHATTVVLRTPLSSPSHLVELLNLTSVRVEQM